MYSLGILLWQLDSRSVPYASQHPQVFPRLSFRFVTKWSGGDVPSGLNGGSTQATSIIFSCNRFAGICLALFNLLGGGALGEVDMIEYLSIGRWLVIILIGLTSTMWSKVSQHFDVGSQQSG